MDNSEVIKHFDLIADKYDYYLNKNSFYHNEINRFICSIIHKNSSVLEVGSATGELIGNLKNIKGVGIDISRKMFESAKKKYPHIRFFCSDLEGLPVNEKFDYVVMSNLLDYIPDIWREFCVLKKFLHKDTRIIITISNPIWELVLRIAGYLRLRTPDGPRNFVTNNDIVNLLDMLDYCIIESGYRIFFPKKIPFFSYLINLIVSRLPGIRNFCIMQFIIAKPKADNFAPEKLSLSVIVPCHDESENLENCIKRIPKMGTFTEIIVVDDGSQDDTIKIAKRLSVSNPNIVPISYFPNRGKGYAVRTGFEYAKGDVLVILDADMAVEPEELPRFFNLIESGKADFVNGTRMIYPREKESMKILNFVGNKIFGIILSLIMGQRNTDTLCGTKALRKKDYSFIDMGGCKWGDFDLLFGAAKLKLRMVEMPVHYKKRAAGKSKMKPFKHGWQLLMICLKGLIEIP